MSETEANKLKVAEKEKEKANKERELELSTYLEELICDYKNLLDMEIVLAQNLALRKSLCCKFCVLKKAL